MGPFANFNNLIGDLFFDQSTSLNHLKKIFLMKEKKKRHFVLNSEVSLPETRLFEFVQKLPSNKMRQKSHILITSVFNRHHLHQPIATICTQYQCTKISLKLTFYMV